MDGVEFISESISRMTHPREHVVAFDDSGLQDVILDVPVLDVVSGVVLVELVIIDEQSLEFLLRYVRVDLRLVDHSLLQAMLQIALPPKLKRKRYCEPWKSAY